MTPSKLRARWLDAKNGGISKCAQKIRQDVATSDEKDLLLIVGAIENFLGRNELTTQEKKNLGFQLECMLEDDTAPKVGETREIVQLRGELEDLQQDLKDRQQQSPELEAEEAACADLQKTKKKVEARIDDLRSRLARVSG